MVKQMRYLEENGMSPHVACVFNGDQKGQTHIKKVLLRKGLECIIMRAM